MIIFLDEIYAILLIKADSADSDYIDVAPDYSTVPQESADKQFLRRRYHLCVEQ